MRLVLLGPPGAGKGTQAEKLSAYLGVPRISTGDILRRNVVVNTPLGEKAKAYMDSGRLEPEDLIKRNTGRRVCPKDDTVYHILMNPPKKPGICDKCGTTLIIRADDKEDVVRKRIETHEKQTAPLIKYYRDRGLLREVYASGLIEEIFLLTMEVLKA